MPFLANTYIWTARSSFSATTKVTTAPTAYLSGVLAAVEPMMASAYTLLPTSGGQQILGNDYLVHLDPGTDVKAGDRIIMCTLLDGVTPYPPEVDWQGTQQPGMPVGSEFWEVTFAQESSPPLAERTAYVKRHVLKGPAVG